MTRDHAQHTSAHAALRHERIERLRLSALLAAGGAALAALSLGAAGCGDQRADEGASTTTVVSAEPGTTTVTTTNAPSPSASPSVPASTESVNAGPGDATGTQARVADDVNTRIIRNPQMTGSRVNVVVDDAGVATLTGFTQNQQQKALAARAAEKTPGVTRVEDKLEVRPTGGTGKTPKPAAKPPAPTTQVIVVPGPAAAAPSPAAPRQSPSPAPSPAASPLEGFETGGTAAPSPAPSAPPLPPGSGTGL